MSKIRRSKRVLEADFKDSKVILNLDTYSPYILNKTASRIWDFCKKPKDLRQIVNFLSERYDISITRAGKDVRRLIAGLKKKGLVYA